MQDIEKQEGGEQMKPTFASPGQVNLPSRWEEYVSEVPTGTKVVNYAKSIKYTARSVQRLLRQQPIIAMYHLNVPVIEGAIYVPRYYKWLQVAAETYQRQHQDAFFEQYPQLLITKPDEDVSTSALRRNYRKYCKRAAHVFYHYVNAASYYTASLVNLLTLSRLSGNEPFKEIAYRFRWSAINSNTTMYKGYPKPKGVENLLATSAKYSIGKSSDLSDIVAFPLYSCDLYGNRGCHILPPDNFERIVALDGQTEDQESLFITDSDRYSLHQLYGNLEDFFKYFGCDSTANATPGELFIENGATASFYDNEFDETATMNTLKNGIIRQFKPAIAGSDWDNLTSTVWRWYEYWDMIMRNKDLKLFYDPRSDWSIIAKQMGILEDSMRPQDLLNIVRSNDGYNMAELLQQMQYKRGNHVSTATIVRYVPQYTVYKDDGSIDQDGIVVKNYERYNIDQYDDISSYIESTKAWPRITPTLFTGVEQQYDINLNAEPFVLNAAPAVYAADIQSSVKPPIGKYATLLDMTLCSDISQENSFVEFVGISSDDAKAWADACDGIVFKEAPNDIFCPVAPLLDNTDIYQCGFNLMISANAGYQTEWDSYFKASGTYKSNIDIEKNFSADLDFDQTQVASPQVPWYDYTTNNHYKYAHVANPDYLSTMGHCFIFVGQALSEPVEFMTTHIEAGNPYSRGFKPCNIETVIDYNNSYATASGAFSTSLMNHAKWFRIESGQLRYGINWDENKDTSVCLAQIFTRSEYKRNKLRLNLFNLSYGMVRPCVQPFPLYNTALYDPCNIGSYDDTARYEFDTAKPLHLTLGPILSGKVHTLDKGSMFYDQFEESIRKTIQSSVVTPAQFYLWFVQSFVSSNADVDEWGVVFVSDGPGYKPPICSGTHKYNAHLMVRSKAMYTGLEDTVPFWSDNLDVQIRSVLDKMNPSISTQSVVTEAEIVTVQDKSFSTMKGKGRQYMPAKADLNDNAANTVQKSFSNTSNQSNRTMKGKRKPRKSKSCKTTGQTYANDNMSVDNSYDYSTRGVDKLASDQRKVKVDSVSIQ